MATSNRARVGNGLELLAAGLRPFIEREMSAGSASGADWFASYRASVGGGGRTISLDDAQTLLNIVKQFWETVFRKTLGRGDRNLVFELADTRNAWAHNEPFTVDATYRALDSIGMLLSSVSAADQVTEVLRVKDELMQARYAEQQRKTAESSTTSITTAPSAGLPPWREVVTPHEDVAAGTFQQAEFAADLGQVMRGQGAAEYSDPVEFFSRTYLTKGLKELLTSAVERLSGAGGVPIVDLQTNFGGGKTHSLLALWHLFGGTPFAQLPEELRTFLTEEGIQKLPSVRRAGLVGTALQAGSATDRGDGVVTNTLWGELAWQLGGADAYAWVADADRTRTSPADALRELFEVYSPCLILIDEWVAYARQLYSRDDLPGGSFDVHFSFAQALTEAARAVPGVLLVISLPASTERDGGEDDSGSALEVGGVGGREALRRLRTVLGRMESPWQPAQAEESFKIVRRRLFQPLPPEKEGLPQEVGRAFGRFYRTIASDVPPECREPAYERSIADAYPIHPELFDRLYSDWSTLERFQRTRGVLRMMATVVHALWVRNDQAPVILPASLPLDDSRVRSELTRYLEDNWAPILDTDIDGPASLPVLLDTQVTNLGRYLAARRVARTVFLGSAPRANSPQHRGIDAAAVRLGCVLPGESVATFGDALNRLSGRATYLYSQAGRYWYGTQPGVTRVAADRAERYRTSQRDEILAHIERQLRSDRTASAFAAVHVAPRTSADVHDTQEARLVVLSPSAPHIGKSEDSAARAAAVEVLDRRGNMAREHRNMLVFLAADHRRLEELEAAAADYLAWQSVVDDAGADGLNLDPNQQRQATTKRDDAERSAGAMLAETYSWLLVPVQPDPTGPVGWEELRADGSGGLAERAGKKLVTEGQLNARYAAALLRLQLDGALAAMWDSGIVTVRELWSAFTRFVYLPRLANEQVLFDAVGEGPASTVWREAFATADAVGPDGRYLGLVVGGYATIVGTTLVVRPDLASRQLESEAEAEGRTGNGGDDEDGKDDEPPTKRLERVLRRYVGSARLDPVRLQRDFGNVAREVIAELTTLNDAEIQVVVEIRAERTEGFPADTVRTIAENARVLGFEHSGFEEQ